MNNKITEDKDKYAPTPWGCLSSILTEYGIDHSHITPRIGTYLIEDFMTAMAKAGYVTKTKNE